MISAFYAIDFRLKIFQKPLVVGVYQLRLFLEVFLGLVNYAFEIITHLLQIFVFFCDQLSELVSPFILTQFKLVWSQVCLLVLTDYKGFFTLTLVIFEDFLTISLLNFELGVTLVLSKFEGLVTLNLL